MDEIHLGDVVRGALRVLPDSLELQRGLLNLVCYGRERAESIGHRLEVMADRNPDRVALRFEDQAWTYGEFNDWANRIADVLAGQGVGRGDCVAVVIENRPEALACVAAIVKLGAVAGLINHQQRGEVLAHSLKLTRARAVIAGEECVEALASADFLPGQRNDVLWLWDGEGGAPAGWQNLRALCTAADDDNRPETAQVQMQDACFYIFTSGTTGLPKASVMTHYRWMRSMAGMGQMSVRLHADDVLYCCLPLYHNNALTVSWSVVLGAGCTLALGRKFSVSRFWDEVRHFGATSFTYIGELCRYLLNRPADPRDCDNDVRVIVGNGLRPEIWDAFQQRFCIERICEFYGASEGNLAFANSLGLTRTAGFCPFPYAIVEFDNDAEIPVRDRKGFMRKVGTGEVGLLITEVTDKAPFDGYTDAEASNKKLFRDVFKKGDCWFNTGDLMRGQGYRHIQFVDRVGDTFRWKGENVATTEVEAAVNQFPGVEHAVVYGVTVPNCDGRAGMASLSFESEPTVERLAELARHLRDKLPAYAVPLFLRVRGEQETTSTMKFRKAALKQQGFDPALVDEPLFVLSEDGRTYAPLTAAEFERINSAQRRL